MNEFGLRQEVLDFIVEAARSNRLEKVILFGSRATGGFHDKSDIDLALLGSDLGAFKEAMEDECPTLLEFDLIDLSADIGAAIRNRIASEGVLLYG